MKNLRGNIILSKYTTVLKIILLKVKVLTE